AVGNAAWVMRGKDGFRVIDGPAISENDTVPRSRFDHAPTAGPDYYGPITSRPGRWQESVRGDLTGFVMLRDPGAGGDPDIVAVQDLGQEVAQDMPAHRPTRDLRMQDQRRHPTPVMNTGEHVAPQRQHHLAPEQRPRVQPAGQ